MTHPAYKNIILEWLKKNPLVFQWQENADGLLLREIASGKSFWLDPNQVMQHRITTHPQGFGEYLNLVFADQTQIVLCHAGIAFSPDLQNTAPLPDAPPVVCLLDYYQMYNHLVDLIKNEEHAQQALRLFEVLIATLDGAKRIGLDVSPEEESLDRLLSAFEKSN